MFHPDVICVLWVAKWGSPKSRIALPWKGTSWRLVDYMLDFSNKFLNAFSMVSELISWEHIPKNCETQLQANKSACSCYQDATDRN